MADWKVKNIMQDTTEKRVRLGRKEGKDKGVMIFTNLLQPRLHGL